MAGETLQISKFAKALKQAGARASLFDVILTGKMPEAADASAGTSSGATNATASIGFTCRATTIPGLTITPIVTQYFGREIKTPGELEFADWSVTILNDNNMRIRRMLEVWSNMINAHGDNVFNAEGSYKSDTNGAWPWTGSAVIQQYNKVGTKTQQYTMEQCWPSSIDPIDMSYDNAGTIQEYGCTFSLNYWEQTAASDGSAVGS